MSIAMRAQRRSRLRSALFVLAVSGMVLVLSGCGPATGPTPGGPPLPPEPENGALPSPVNIPDIFLITGTSWTNPEVEAFIRSEIDRGCGELGPACVDYEVVVDSDPSFLSTEDCPVRQVRIPDPTYDGDLPETPDRDDLITIAINDPCDGVVVTTEPSPSESE